LRSQVDLGFGKIGLEEKNIMYKEKWFHKKYERFTPNTRILETVITKLKSSKIIIFMGVWCPDTKVYLPRFIKLFDSLDIPEENIVIYSVDRSKKNPRKFVRQYDIEYLPTVIFSDENKEIGRIVEFPYDTIEKDILNILRYE
jgi:thiol-disulfide isomerase/thioredoxin